jgi:hypothetical protein
LAFCAILGVTVATALIGSDPYDTGQLAVFRSYGVPASLGPRLAVASVARAPAMEAAIVGNSTIQLVDPARLGEAIGTRFVTLAIAGTGPLEQLAVARWFVRHHQQPKAIVFSLDRSWCEADGRIELPNPFPFWLYSADWFEYALGMLQLKTFESVQRKIKLMQGLAPPLSADGYRDYESEHPWNAEAAERASFATGGSEFVSDPPNFAAVSLMRAFRAELPVAARVVFIFPPRHHSALPPPGSAAALFEARCKAAFRDLSERHARTFVLDLAVDSDIARDDHAFWDQVHYRGQVARLIEADVARALSD